MTMIDRDGAVGGKPAVPRARPLSDIALSGIYEISKILTRPARLETTLSNVLNLLSSFLDMRRGTILLIGDDDIPDIVVGTCWSESLSAETAIDLPRAALDQIIATQMPLVVQNVARHPLFAGCASPEACGETVAFVGLPIKIGDKVVGTLSIDRQLRGTTEFTLDNDMRFLAMIANLIGQTIQLHRVIARDRERLMEESRRLQKELTVGKPSLGAPERVAGIIGNSAQVRALLDKIAIVAKSNATVLLRGESGTGKELFARAIHELSPRAKKAFIKVNCAALPETVLESELFGHEKGAFTGAVAARKGRFELADGGTIFLDEIGEISAAFQAKLLRVLQEGEFDRVGASRTQKVDVRVVAATNRDLEDAVARGTFRADLYYRISVVPLLLPPLRERKGDIAALAENFLKQFNKENGRDLKLTQGAIDVLKACYFPGNVRELHNCVCRTATLTKGAIIEAHDFACGHGECLSSTLWKARSHGSASQPRGPAGISLPGRGTHLGPPAAAAPVEPETHNHDTGRPCTCGAFDDVEGGCPTPADCEPSSIGVTREKLVEAMERSGWVQAKAARILGLTPRQIGYALKKHDVELKKF